MKDDWENPYEEDGVTLGPEEALLRETEKTKALKVEKLQLKDTIENYEVKIILSPMSIIPWNRN